MVDTWDALRSDRVYRKAWAVEKVIKYLNQNAGTIYDPHIVEVFVGIIQKRVKGSGIKSSSLPGVSHPALLPQKHCIR